MGFGLFISLDLPHACGILVKTGIVWWEEENAVGRARLAACSFGSGSL